MSDQMNYQGMETGRSAEAAMGGEAVAVAPVKKSKKKWLIILGIIAVIVIALVVASESKFEQVKDQCVELAGQVSRRGDNEFTIDTRPSMYESGGSLEKMWPDSTTQSKALSAIKYANEAFGFSSSVYSDMMETNALMGRQSVENEDYRISWTYHPQSGLEVTYYEK